VIHLILSGHPSNVRGLEEGKGRPFHKNALFKNVLYRFESV
jgi:hypothetical protein